MEVIVQTSTEAVRLLVSDEDCDKDNCQLATALGGELSADFANFCKVYYSFFSIVKFYDLIMSIYDSVLLCSTFDAP